MENRSKLSRRVYLILTWRLPGWSSSVATSFPTSVPAAGSLVRTHQPSALVLPAPSSSPALLFSSTITSSEPVNLGALSFMSSMMMLNGRGWSVSSLVFWSKTLTVNYMRT